MQWALSPSFQFRGLLLTEVICIADRRQTPLLALLRVSPLNASASGSPLDRTLTEAVSLTNIIQ